ncbi:hypothetical protein WKI65_43665 [Streptomyces sp. MS1.AVA.3]|uniref:hypothetical protein n=1 Tax=Streptomyces decoyicus TaxID=249567 RepID=UPI0030BE1F72
MTLQPPNYEWTAQTAQEAETSLVAAKELIDAHLKTLMPGDPYIRNETRRTTPLKVRISVDLGPVIEAINEARQLNGQSEPDDDAPTNS